MKTMNKKLQKCVTLCALLLTGKAFSLGQVPNSFDVSPGTTLTCISGPGILELNFEEVINYGPLYEKTFKVTGFGLTNTYGISAKNFETSLKVKEVSTRAYWGDEIEGNIEAISGSIHLKNHIWYSYSQHDIPTHYTGTFESFQLNQAYALTCFPKN